VIASLIETCKLLGVEPQPTSPTPLPASSTAVPKTALDDLLPWAYPAIPQLKAVA
jgi:hypothetical protein